MCNVIPAFVFAMAWALRMEKVRLREVRSWAKVIGTVVTVGGAMLMTLIKGRQLDLTWTRHYVDAVANVKLPNHDDTLKGALMIGIDCICWSAFIILQVIINLLKFPDCPLQLLNLVTVHMCQLLFKELKSTD